MVDALRLMTVKMRHDHPQGIPEVPFKPSASAPAGLDVLSLAEFRACAGIGDGSHPRRPAFHHLLAVTSGTLRHTVDFTDYTLGPGNWLWSRPGQVQRWGDLTQSEGTLILFRQDIFDIPTAAAARLDDFQDPVVRAPVAQDAHALQMALQHLATEFRNPGQLPLHVHTAVLRQLLAVLVLRLAHLTGATGTSLHELDADPDTTYLRFRDAVEQHFRRTRRVADYARLLGYSPRTLSRASLDATGIGAKQFIDRRVIVEAQRMLMHSDQTAVQIAAQLCFPSPTHFSKYFHQRTGQTPIAFRATALGGARDSLLAPTGSGNG
ncbi:helix-turn-helix domain-containing protein [Streptomyces canus]|uniref:helix-turn-helix transcriptional regulator n=1 Tax=Streptomyces canus TaxID=58343 RepID=UPI003699EBB5